MNKLIELKNAVKSKILFRTEDSVDIFEGDEVACINKHTFKPTGYGRPVNNPKPDTFLYFSTKEAAEEYILMNKHCLSIQDLIDSNLISMKRKNSKNILTKLVKSKL